MGRFGNFYLNRQFQQRTFVLQEGSKEEDPSRGRKRGRYDDKSRPSRRHSEDDRARDSSRGREKKRGYSATVTALTDSSLTPWTLRSRP